jgi:hypothetical protein
VALGEKNSGIVNKLVDDGLGGLLLVDDGRNLAHQEGTGVVKGLVIDIVGKVLKVVLDRNDALGGELLDLVLAVLLPVGDVGVIADTEGTTLRSSVK